MAYWDGTTIHHFPPKKVRGKKGWYELDCGCCAGIEWGGEEPRECKTCNGSATIYLHKPTGTLTRWIGGPCIGREPRNRTPMTDAEPATLTLSWEARVEKAARAAFPDAFLLSGETYRNSARRETARILAAGFPEHAPTHTEVIP